MQKVESNKKLSFRIITSILLFAVVGFLFVPGVMLTTKTITTNSTTKASSTFSGAQVVGGAFFVDNKSIENNDQSDELVSGINGVAYIRDNGAQKGISSEVITNALAVFLLLLVMFCVSAAILNIFTISNKWPKYNKHVNPMIAYLICAAIVCAIVAFVISFFWVSGEYGNDGLGETAVRTGMQSYGYIGFIGNIILPALAFVFFHDRKLKE